MATYTMSGPFLQRQKLLDEAMAQEGMMEVLAYLEEMYVYYTSEYNQEEDIEKVIQQMDTSLEVPSLPSVQAVMEQNKAIARDVLSSLDEDIEYVRNQIDASLQEIGPPPLPSPQLMQAAMRRCNTS